MTEEIIVDLDIARNRYSEYTQKFPGKKFHKCFEFDTNISIKDNLNQLSFFALDETLPVLYSFPEIFFDLISRWVEEPTYFDSQYKKAFNLSHFNIDGSIIIYSLSKLVKVSDEPLNLIEFYLNNNDIFDRLHKSISLKNSISAPELEIILLAFFRLIDYDNFKFRRFINPKVLHSLLSIELEEYNVVKYLTVLLLGSYLESSEAVLNQMLATHTISSSLISNYEQDKIDYRFLNIVEAKRIENFHNSLKDRTNSNLNTSKNSKLSINQSHLSGLVTSIYGVLVPHLISSSSTEQQKDTLVTTENSINVLKRLATNIQNNHPTLLFGKAGSGKTFLFNQLAKIMGYQDSIVKIHLGEQTDAKLLLGTYSSGEKPGTFKWRSGVLTTAVKEGKWVLIEDIDKAPTEVLSILLTLLEKRQLIIPSRGEVIKAHNNFQLISTIRIANDNTQNQVPDLIGLRLWHLVEVKVPSEFELMKILSMKFPLLSKLNRTFIKCYNEILKIYSTHSFVALNRGSHPRLISSRDLIKFCSRCNKILINNGITSTEQLLESSIYDNFFQEAIDCFGSAITEHEALIPLSNTIGECLEVPPSRINLFLSKHIPMFMDDENSLRVGRAILPKSLSDKALNRSKKSNNVTSFATTNHSLRLMEQICVSIEMLEPVLLVGETGTGKTTVVQQVAKLMNKKLTVINVSQQTESGDLLGGYKPVNTKIIAIPLQEVFENLFITTFSRKKNEKFSMILSKVFNRNQWKNVIKLWREAIKMAKELLDVEVESESDNDGTDTPKKKRRLRSHERKILLDKWIEFEGKVKDFEIQSSSLDNSFVFNFVEGSLVNAIRSGDWLLLDEINLASSDTLESIADLLADSVDQRSILLSEKGDVEPIKAHPDFRIFGCMNPSTDVGKKDLPLSIRSRFTEIYVHSPDKDFNDLLAIIDKYISRFAVSDDLISHDIANLYLEAKKLSDSNKIVDGANQKPHFSIRTLTRTLIYVVDIISIYGLRRSLYEGFCMSFLTLLDMKSEEMLKPLIEKYTIGKLKNMKSVMSQAPPCPSKTLDEYVQFRHYWMKHGPEPIIPQPNYIITPFVEKNMLNLVRATAGRRFPVLIQGPTSAGKTSMINYLANITGHKFVRINNHEHTDLQEYLGTYVSDSTGKLTFREGILVEAIRNGYWIVLDELNLAPTDILEALNRLLDDNRELFIPETQEVVHPHPEFMLFATQNPPGLYGGRKMLSRAFRNRFLELHFDDIPQDELEIILKERCQIAPSYCKRIVEVYKQLTIQRQSTRLFEQKNSFATLRDLFRWAFREAVGYEELAANGYMLLAERVRKEDEKLVVKQTIEKVMRVKLDMDAHYESLEQKALMNIESSIVWTKAMRRLAVLVFTSMKYKEPLLLVGETGCGKTTVCQVIAQYLNQQLITVNAHQNTETSDILGAQRPVRNRFETRSRLFNNLVTVFGQLNIDIPLEQAKLEDLIKKYQTLDKTNIDKELILSIDQDIINSKILFEWSDGPLVHAMKDGEMFLLDEISLADDSVLERLNSVLEPERSLLLAEKGVDDSFIVANEKFQFLATMNPGGDYGKKELSPALRNRFTEIWVPSMDDFNDVRQIVSSKLNNNLSHLTEIIVQFAQYFGTTYGGGNATSGVISLRDILAWVQFINANHNIPHNTALVHGAAMVFIDALGTNNTAYLAENEEILKEHKMKCVSKLSELAGDDLLSMYTSDFDISLTKEKLIAGSFSVDRVTDDIVDDFLLHAPTTAANAMRVIRAMQVHKPILLEGSPGVGKTSLISAIAKATGNNLIRINLSEQTDLVDLFGSDSPAEGGKTGEFVWRDAPFLRAMQRGEWVLLDEMNLASQSVLEGLNACLDHRGEAFIPELDKSFPCHPDFTVFAAQNPQYQGGGRKGLPKSFVNRFTVVYVDVLKNVDLRMISNHLYPNIKEDVSSKMIDFMSQLEEQVVIKKAWGSSGGPWEFNLRDTLRWLGLYNSTSLAQDIEPSDYLEMIISQRFRTSEDRNKVKELFKTIFGEPKTRDNYYKKHIRYIQAGTSVIERKQLVHFNQSNHSIPLQTNFRFIEAAIRCINHNLPLILTGPSSSGKTELIRFIAQAVGAKINEFAMNSDVDSMDILGGYEQVDLTRVISSIIINLKNLLQELILKDFETGELNELVQPSALEFYGYLETTEIDMGNFKSLVEYLKAFLTIHSSQDLLDILQECYNLLEKIADDTAVKFEWFDGLLVQAVEKGYWLILDNANLCSPSVLDRLNSLLETNGSLIINECSTEDGQPRILKPHPNFRLFLTMDPKYGELSRAMRNRGIELYLEPLAERATPFDRRLLGFKSVKKEEETDIIEEQLKDLSVGSSSHSSSPMLKFISAMISIDYSYSQLLDLSGEEKSSTMASLLTGLVQFDMFHDIPRWVNTIRSSSEFNDTTKYFANELETRLQLLESMDLKNPLMNVYEAISADFQWTQTFDPAINNAFLAILSNKNRAVSTSEPNYFFYVLGSILEFQTQLYNIEQKAMSGNMADLTYVEKSAAVYLGRNVKKAPRLNVYPFLKSINDFFNKVVKDASVQIFKFDGVFKSLFDLSIIRSSLLTTAHGQNESQIRVYRDLIIVWCKENSDTNIIRDSLQALWDAIAPFSNSLELETGFLMEKIWESFRSSYPNSSQGWSKLEVLINLFTDFDSVAIKQDPESIEQISGFKTNLLSIYEAVIDGSISDNEFEEVVSNLVNGISKLKAISESYDVERTNEFQEEFNLLSMFVQSNQMISNEGITSDLLVMSSYAGRPTIQFSRTEAFKPYPAVLDNLSTLEDGKYSSSVSELFDNSVVSGALNKSIRFQETSGKLLNMKLKDLKTFGTSLIEHHEYLVTDLKVVFKEILMKWIQQTVNVEIEDAQEDILSWLSGLSGLSSQFSSIVTKYFIPACKLVNKSTSKDQLGVAFVLFACGAIQTYLPSSAYDPAIKEHVLFEKLNKQRIETADLVDTWMKASDLLGGEEIHAYKVVKGDKESKEPLKPRVYRPDQSFDNLFEEWKVFMESSVNAEHLEKLLDAAVEVSTESEQLINMFQNNSSQFISRIDGNYKMFSDLNDILKGYILTLKLGYDLITSETAERRRYSTSLLDITNISKIGNYSNVESIFNDILKFSKKQKPDSQISERLMGYMMNVAFAHGEELSQDILNQALQSVYYRWSLRKMKEAEQNLQDESLYKYNDPDMDIEEDFRILFPDYDEVMDVDIGTIKSTQSFDDVYYKLAKAYMTCFENNNLEVSDLVKEGNEIIALLYDKRDKFKAGSVSNSDLVNSVISFASSYNKFTQDSGVNFDFYRESSHVETRKALDVVYKIITTTSKLLEEWPDHATLKDIVRVCKEFLDYPLSIPIARQLQKIEQIYTFIVEWEKYASSKVTLKTHFEQLTNLIVSWRRLELSTWKELFNNEDRALEVNIGKWWFHLFESIILPLYSEKEIQLTALLSALNVFISQTSIGEFRFRLRLVKAFRQHVYQIQGKGDSYTAITNFIKFYEQFMGKVEEKIANERKSLEKDINEVILLASWKDVNIDALKQSARKSHNSLYKIVRKYRSLLASSVGVIIEQGLPQDGSSSVVTRLPSVRGIAIDNEKVGKFASQVSTWNDRPKRLQDLSMVDRNMSIYVKRISEEKLPTLYEYAKEIVSEASRLQQETPNVYTEETKKTIAGLKNEKAKLLSDTLKELRRIGIKTTSKPEVKKAQSSSNLLLSISTSFDNTFLEGIDDYYFKIIDLLPRLKSAVSSPSEDAPQADIAKGFGAAENAIYSLITAREPLVNLSDSIQELGDITETLNMVSETSDSEISMVPSTKVKCTKEILIVIKSLLIWVPRVVSFAIEANSAIETINGKPQDSYLLHQIKDKFQAFEAEYNSLNLNVITTSALTFIDRFEAYIEKIRLELNSKTNFVFKMITQWIDSREVNLFVNSNTSLSELNVAEDIEIILREVTSNIIVVIQKITELHNAPISEEDDDWFTVSQKRFYDYMKSTFHKKLTSKLKNLVEKLSTIEYNSQTSRITSSLVAISAPIIQHYHKLLVSILSNNREIYQDNSHAAYMLATILHTLASKGFCSPDAPSEEKTDDNLKDGTGLGDGEGGSNNTNDVEEDDDLTEQAQTENKEKEEPNEQEDDAVEMEGDMAGDLESGSDQDDNEDEEEEKEDMDEEIDDIDELDPNEIDEKMWDEEAKENKEKESENVPENKQEDMVANEDDPTENQDKPQDEAQEESNEQEENEKEDNKQEEDDDGEDKDVGEQDDEVQNQENDQVDENISDTDVLDLPEDMNLDGDDEGEEEEAGEDDMDLNDKLNEDDEKVEENEDVEEEQQDAKEDVDAAMEDEGEEQDEQEGEDNEDDEKAEVGDDVGEEAEMSEDEEIGGKEEEKPQQEEEGGGDEDQQETTEGVDGANNDDMDEDIDVESAVKQEAGEKGEGSDNQVIEEQDDLGASGGASTNIQEQEKQENQNAPQDDENSEAKESIKELGDALKEFHRRHQEIKEASKEKEEVVEEKANERPDEFEHVDGENTNTDTQAMGAADKDQMQAMDEDKAIDDDEPADEMEQDEPDIKQEPADGDDMEDIENLEEQENQEDADFKGKTKGGFINDRTKTKDEFEILKHEIEDDLSLEDYDFMDEDVKVTDDDLAPISLDQARELWRNSELATQELASGLCEQLRLILEPTLATKLRGDYKTGKRLNMKRIIPYIASEFRKDKIWLRRTKPSKRQYQIMIAVDDSKSMSESKSTELAFHSIALVSKALTQLESGGLSIVRFGEDVKVVHPFDKPFNNQESGPRIFQYFDFQQTRTDIKNLCKKSLNIFETSKMNGNNDLWQLQIIISDGVCEDHETVQALVRKARESRIMLVFVVIDGINSNESILDMSQVRYEFDNNGKSVLKVDKYLDSFPFEFYVVVRNINELPEMLALILRQYFTEIASN